MFEKVVLACKTLVEKICKSSNRFPEAIFLAATIVVILCTLNHISEQLSSENLAIAKRITMTLGLGIPIALSTRVFFERKPFIKTGIRVIIYGAATIGLGLYYLFLLPDMNIIALIRYTAVTISFYGMFIFIPYFYKKANYELYVIRLVTRFFVTYLYSLILFFGLAALIATVNALLFKGISHRIYADIGFIVIGIFGPVFFLSDVPDNHEDLTVDCYPKVLKMLLLYIVMPLITVYSIILYVYFAKILITMQWPEGIVANLVMWYSLISITVIFAIYPLRYAHCWVKNLVFGLPLAILPLLAMMFVALGIRIQTYGITENRYFMFIAGLWIAGCMVYFIVIKAPRMIFLPISITIITLLSIMGPWNCFSVATSSQGLRLEQILNKYNLIENGMVARVSQDVSAEDKMEIGNIISYFDRYKKLNDLQFLPPNFTVANMKEVFGFSSTDRNWQAFHHTAVKQQKLLNISGFDFLCQVSAGDINVEKSEMPISVNYAVKSGEVRIMKLDQVIYSNNFNTIAKKIHYNSKMNAAFNSQEMIFTEENEKVKVLYVINSISGVEENGEVTIEAAHFSLLIKLK